jgi:cation transport ATPase
MRDHARSAVLGLAKMTARGGNVVGEDGASVYTPVDEIEPGMVLRVAPGERIPADGRVVRAHPTWTARWSPAKARRSPYRRTPMSRPAR